jgi:hypothetical protein
LVWGFYQKIFKTDSSFLLNIWVSSANMQSLVSIYSPSFPRVIWPLVFHYPPYSTGYRFGL